jgi:hypothetical protein
MALSQSKNLHCFPHHQATHIGRLTSFRSERQYKYRFKRWDFEKNISNPKMRAISSKNNGRLSLEQKETVFHHHHQPINPQKIKRWEQRYNSSTADGAQSSAPTPPGVTYYTPAPSASSPPPSLRQAPDSPRRDHDLNHQAPSFSPEPVMTTPGYGQPLPCAPYSYQQVGDTVAPALIARLKLLATGTSRICWVSSGICWVSSGICWVWVWQSASSNFSQAL